MGGDWWGLEDPPASATWPRLASGRHPRAVGTYGPEMLAWASERKLHPKRSAVRRWWQRAVSFRALEHDAAGDLLWGTVIVSGPRQVGKSWLERDVCAWRIHQSERWGEEQTLLHVAHKLPAAQEVWRPAARWAAGVYGPRAVRWANGEQQIELPDDGSRWMIQAANDGSGVAFSLSHVLVDEAWRVPRVVFDDAIVPTMAEAASPQAWLVSTAGTSDSDLMMGNRAAAIALLGAADPGDTLLIEWSAPPDPDLDIDDRAVWRAATPHWDERREQRMASARAKVSERAFRQQWLNQWVPTVTPPLLGSDAWDRVVTLAAPSGRLAIGVEIEADRSAALIVVFGGAVLELVERLPVASTAGRVLELAAAHRAVAVCIDGSGPAATLADPLASLGDRLVVMSGADAAAAAGELFDRMTSSPARIGFRAHPLLQAAVVAARKRSYGQKWAWERTPAAGVSGAALVAGSCAVWAGLHAPVPVAPFRIL